MSRGHASRDRTDMRNLERLDGTNSIDWKRFDSNRLAGQTNKFNLERMTVRTDMHDRPKIFQHSFTPSAATSKAGVGD